MITVTDIFAGAGESTSDAIMVPGVEVRVSVNHWRLAVDDCEFSTVESHEVVAGMALRLDYQWLVSRRDRVKLAGNAVCPPAARDQVSAVVDALP